MTTLHVTEYQGVDGGLSGPVGLGPAAANDVVYANAAVYSAAFGQTTRAVRLVADSDCYYLISRKSKTLFTPTGESLGTANNGAAKVSGFTTDIVTTGITPLPASVAGIFLSAGVPQWIYAAPGQCVSVLAAFASLVPLAGSLAAAGVAPEDIEDVPDAPLVGSMALAGIASVLTEQYSMSPTVGALTASGVAPTLTEGP